MRAVSDGRPQLVGSFLLAGGILLGADELRHLGQYVAYLAAPGLFRLYFAFTGADAWLGWVPEVVFAAALILTILWMVRGTELRIALALVVVGLLIHAVSGFFYAPSNSANFLTVVIESIGLVGGLASAVLAISGRLLEPVVRGLLSATFFVLTLAAAMFLACVLYSVLLGYPFASLAPSGDLQAGVYDVTRDLVIVVVEIIGGGLQAATGIAIIVTSARPPLAD